MMAQTLQKSGTTSPPTRESGEFSFGSLLRRPETGAFLGLFFVFVFFAIFGGVNFIAPTGAASYLNVAANLGIVALPIGLLMIAGELDISIGSMIPAGAMTVAIVSGHFGAPIIVGMAASLALGVLVGLINGILVVRTAVPSLIVTLGTLFAVQGLVLGLSVLLTGTTSVALYAPGWAKFLFGSFIGGSLPGDDLLVDRDRGGLRLLHAPQPLGQLDLRHGRRQGQRPQRRHPDRPADDHALRPLLDQRRLRRHVPDDPLQLGAGLRRHVVHLQRHHRGRRRRRAADRRLRLGDRHLLRHADLRDRQPGHLLHRLRRATGRA